MKRVLFIVGCFLILVLGNSCKKNKENLNGIYIGAGCFIVDNNSFIGFYDGCIPFGAFKDKTGKYLDQILDVDSDICDDVFYDFKKLECGDLGISKGELMIDVSDRQSEPFALTKQNSYICLERKGEDRVCECICKGELSSDIINKYNIHYDKDQPYQHYADYVTRLMDELREKGIKFKDGYNYYCCDLDDDEYYHAIPIVKLLDVELDIKCLAKILHRWRQ